MKFFSRPLIGPQVIWSDPHPSRGFPRVFQAFLGFSWGFPGVFTGFSLGLPGVCPGFARGFPGVFARFSRGFPGVFQFCFVLFSFFFFLRERKLLQPLRKFKKNKNEINPETSPKLYWSYYPNRSRDSLFPVCRILLWKYKNCNTNFYVKSKISNTNHFTAKWGPFRKVRFSSRIQNSKTLFFFFVFFYQKQFKIVTYQKSKNIMPMVFQNTLGDVVGFLKIYHFPSLFEEKKKRYNFVHMFKILIMSIFHNSQKNILKLV